jgi:NADH-quinone oxidoreductase subunit L
VPLVILAVPSTIIGLIIGIPPEEGLIHDWLAPIFHDVEAAGILPGSMLAGYAARGEAHHFAFFGTGGLLLLAATIGAAAGIWLAYRWYVRDVESPRRFVERIPLGMGPGMYRASANRYYIDDIYNLVFARGGVLVSNALWWFDARVIDGAVDGAGWVSQRSGAALRRVQTGHVENYGLGIAAGLVVVLIAFLVAVR